MMEGPFQLADPVIDAVVKRADAAVFLLRRIEEVPKYAYYRGFVGSCTGDEDLAQSLRRWLDSDYRVFCFEYVESEDAAYERQCEMWHELGGPEGKLDNEAHPKPDGSNAVRCPLC